MKSDKLIKTLLCAFFISVLYTLLTFSASALEYRDDLKIKVGLEFGPTSPAEATFTSEEGFRAVSFNEETYETELLFETAQPMLTVKNVNGIATVYIPDGTEVFRSSDNTLYLMAISGSMQYLEKTYLEVMKIFCKDGLMRVINIVSFENYLKGVLPREIYPSWPEEALKTAAIAARTFGLYSLGGKHTKYGIDVCTTTCCQVYGGNGANEHPATNAAIDATKNIILAYNGKVAMAVYTSSAGYTTESSSGAWGGSQELHPYLCGVDTPHETPEKYSNGTWSNTVANSDVLAYIDSKSSYSGKLKDTIASIVIEYADNGYGRKITVTDTSGNSVSAKNSDGVRGMLSKFAKSAKVTVLPNYETEDATVSVLTADGVCTTSEVPKSAYVLRADSEVPSILFNGSPYPISFTISGTGWGHGVGLSQFGTMTLAKNGKTHTEILSLYYPGTYLTTIGELGAQQKEQQQQQNP